MARFENRFGGFWGSFGLETFWKDKLTIFLKQLLKTAGVYAEIVCKIKPERFLWRI